MIDLLTAVRLGIITKNFYAALYTALAIPDICAAIENGKTSGAIYSAWWNKYMGSYSGYLSGDDCYSLRCAALHQGTNNIVDQKMKDALDYFVFMSDGGHLTHVAGLSINGDSRSFLRLNTQTFCEDICLAAERWLRDVGGNNTVQDGIKEMLVIHDPGYVHLDVFKFL